MLQAVAQALIPALSNKLWNRMKKLEAEILQRLVNGQFAPNR
jgi:hypothetical protein